MKKFKKTNIYIQDLYNNWTEDYFDIKHNSEKAKKAFAKSLSDKQLAKVAKMLGVKPRAKAFIEWLNETEPGQPVDMFSSNYWVLEENHNFMDNLGKTKDYKEYLQKEFQKQLDIWNKNQSNTYTWMDEIDYNPKGMQLFWTNAGVPFK